MNVKDFEFFKALQGSKKKTYIVVAVCIIAAVIAIVIICKYKDVKNLIIDKKANDKLVEEANQTIIVSDITLTQDQFDSYAKKLYRAMKGAGTNEAAIYEVYEQMNTRSDVKQLEKTFGIVNGESLQEWLYADLETDEIMHINSILSSKAINYKY